MFLLVEFGFCSLPLRPNFDSNGFIRYNLYGEIEYLHMSQLEYFWEDCAYEREVQRMNLMSLTIDQVIAFELSLLVPKSMIGDGSDLIDESY